MNGFVSQIIQCPKHDVIINMPYQDLYKKCGSATKSTPEPIEIELLKNYNEMFGHSRWQKIAQGIDLDRCNALSKKVTIKGAKNRQGAKLSKSQSLTEPLNQISVA